VRFILASASPSRAAVLRAAAVPFTIMPAEIDEARLKSEMLSTGTDAAQIAAALAEAKAVAVSKRHADALVLGADQVLEFDGELVSKCADMAAARALLLKLRGRSHRLLSALALAQDGKTVWALGDSATLTMRRFSDSFLDRYLSEEGTKLLAGVGCYRLEGMGAQLFESVKGDYFSILGLPLQPLLAQLRQKGVIAQ
jgi:septum formation protein